MQELPKASVYQRLLVPLGYLHQYLCEGNSMFPTLKHGEAVLVDRSIQTIEVGDIVVAKHPVEQITEVIKRVKEINSRGHYFLVGDNLDDSNDSRNFGAVTRDYIKGKVIAKIG